MQEKTCNGIGIENAFLSLLKEVIIRILCWSSRVETTYKAVMTPTFILR